MQVNVHYSYHYVWEGLPDFNENKYKLSSLAW